MPDDPNSNLDAQLQAFAQQRRRQQGEPFVLPPATRHALQAEVDRQYGGTSAGATPAGSRWFSWLYLAWGTVGLAVVAVGLALAWPFLSGRQRGFELAKAPPATPRAEPAARPSREAPAPRRPEPSAADGPAKTVGPLALTKEQRAPVAPATREPETRTPSAPAAGLALAPAVADAVVPVPTLAAPSAPVAAAAPPRAGRAGESGAEPNRRQDSAAPTNPALSVRAALSTNFQQPSARQFADGGYQTRYGLAGTAAPSGKRVIAPAPAAGALARSSPPPRPTALPTTDEARKVPQAETARGLAQVDQAQNQSAMRRQRFVAAPSAVRLRRNLNSPPRPPVLADFQLAQSGNRIEITDADGSVYRGELQPAGDRAAAQQGGDLSFQTIGTNRSSGQRVVFNARLQVTNAAPGAILNAAGAGAAANNAAQGAFANAMLEGQAQVGTRTRLQIRAAPVGP